MQPERRSGTDRRRNTGRAGGGRRLVDVKPDRVLAALLERLVCSDKFDGVLSHVTRTQRTPEEDHAFRLLRGLQTLCARLRGEGGV